MPQQHHPFRNALIVLFCVLIVVIGLFWWYTLTHPRTTSTTPVASNTGYHFNPLAQGTVQEQPTPPENLGVPRDTTTQTPATTPATTPDTTELPTYVVNEQPTVVITAPYSPYVPPKSAPATVTTGNATYTSQPTSGGSVYTYTGSNYPPQTTPTTPVTPAASSTKASSPNHTLNDILTYMQIFGTLTGNPIDVSESTQDLTNGLFSGNPFDTSGGHFGLFGGGGGGGGGFGGGGGGGGAVQSFGTMTITNITECTCSASRLLDMQDTNKRTLSLLVTAGSQVKAEAMSMYGIRTGTQALGTYTSGGVCEVIHGDECDQQGNPQGSVVTIGTSK